MVRLERQYFDEMIAYALEEAPNECCGILAGKNGQAVKLFRAINDLKSPYRYNVAPQDLFRIDREIRENDWEWLGIYHSHTFSEAYPSPTDVNLAFWPDAVYFIVSLMNPGRPHIRAFRISREEGRIQEEELEVKD